MNRRHSHPAPPYKVGELAELANLSVRTLHHYEDINLLVPSARSPAGHRLYSHADLKRLFRIKALAALGLTLEQVRRCLDDDTWSPLHLIEIHLARAREAMQEQHALCERLMRLRDGLQEHGDDVAHFIESMGVMTMIERYYTPEQLQTLSERRAALGEDAIRKVEEDWQALFSEVKTLIEDSAPVDSPRAQAVARKWNELTQQTVAGFTGGDPGLRRSLDPLSLIGYAIFFSMTARVKQHCSSPA